MSNILPVITLWQPWATWIMRGWKTIETRTHSRFTSLYGKTILIHAGMTTDDSSFAVKNPYLTHEQIIYNPEEVINGFILGSVFVGDVHALDDSASSAALIDCGSVDRFGLFLEDVNKFEIPIREKGGMGIWYYDMDKKEKVKKILIAPPKIETLKLF